MESLVQIKLVIATAFRLQTTMTTSWTLIVNDWLPPMFPRIQERRTTPQAKKAAELFLLNISPEVVLQIAMMCDAAQEELDLSLVSQFVIDIVTVFN